MKPKASTLSKRFGFQDPDLTSPLHDKIVLALLKPENMLEVLKQTSLKKTTPSIALICEHRYNKHGCDYGLCGELRDSLWKSIKQEKIRISLKHNPQKEIDRFGDTLTVYDEQGERHHLYKDRYMDNKDFYQQLRCPFFAKEWRTLTALCPLEEEAMNAFIGINKIDAWNIVLNSLNIETEYVITNNYSNFVIGFIDLNTSINFPGLSNKFFQLSWEKLYNDHFIEVKTKITSFGETMRQINMYRKFVKGRFILVTTTKGYKDAFESQGIHVYEWDSMLVVDEIT